MEGGGAARVHLKRGDEKYDREGECGHVKHEPNGVCFRQDVRRAR